MHDNIEYRRIRPRLLIGPAMAMMIVLSGCASLGSGHKAAASPPAFASGHESPRDQLNDGYTDFYTAAQGLQKVDEIFYVKIESDDVQRVVEDITDYSGNLAQRLQSLKDDFPALALDRKTVPPIITAANEAQKNATLKRFAPVVGTSGKAFERGILIRILGAVDQQHYLAATLAKREPNPALSKIMANAASRYAGFYDEIDDLLKKRFYR